MKTLAIKARRLNQHVLILAIAVLLAQPFAFAKTGQQAEPDRRDLREAEKLNSAVTRLYEEGKYKEAIPLAERALAIREKVLGAEHPQVAQSLTNLAALYDGKGDLANAERMYRRALTIYGKAFGPEHPEVAMSLINLGRVYQIKGDYLKAEEMCQRALPILEKAFGREHPYVAHSLNALGVIYQAQGDYLKAEEAFKQSLTIYEKVLGPESPDIAHPLNNLAGLYREKGDYPGAEEMLKRSVAIYEKSFGPKHPYVAYSLNTLAGLYREKGDYLKAEPLYQRALGIWEAAHGEEHPTVATALDNLARFYEVKGDYVMAEKLGQRALKIYEKLFGPEHPDVAIALGNLASVYQEKGDYLKAELLYQRSLAILEKALSAEHPTVATALDNLAGLYHHEGDYAKEEVLRERALKIYEKNFGPEHPDVAIALSNLAGVYETKGNVAKAEEMFHRSLTITIKIFGPEHPGVATPLNNLAGLYTGKGDYAKAEKFYQRALDLNEKGLGPEHPLVASTLNNLADVYELKGDIPKAVAYRSRASDVREHNLLRNLASGSERQKLAYIDKSLIDTNNALTLHINLAPQNVEATQLAVTTLLRRKGRVLDTVTDTIATIRRRASKEDQKIFDQLASTRSQLAVLTRRGPGPEGIKQYRANLTALEEQVEKFEADTSDRSAEFRAQQIPITLANVQKLIPSNAALVEFAIYRPFDLKESKYGASRYVAYVIRNHGAPQGLELGDAKEIDELVKTFRKALRDKDSLTIGGRVGSGKNAGDKLDVKATGRQLDEKIMAPVRRLLGETRKVILSPDGLLNLIPFAALVSEDGLYLVKNYAFTYLTSGRDLLRLQAQTVNRQPPLIMADANFDYDAKTKTSLTAAPGPRLGDHEFLPLMRLRASADEANEVSKVFLGGTLLVREKANKTELKKSSGPLVLHIATHGFF
jgi:tetratricopeptide (TPR) repeat protein